MPVAEYWAMSPSAGDASSAYVYGDGNRKMVGLYGDGHRIGEFPLTDLFYPGFRSNPETFSAALLSHFAKTSVFRPKTGIILQHRKI